MSPAAQVLQRTRSFKDKMDPLLASPRLLALRSACRSRAGRALETLVLQLGRDAPAGHPGLARSPRFRHTVAKDERINGCVADGGTFGRSLTHFVQCTLEAKEQRAAAVLRNVRQFISGMKVTSTCP